MSSHRREGMVWSASYLCLCDLLFRNQSLFFSFFSLGLEPQGNTVGAPARFTVETFSAGRGTVDVLVLNPKGQKEPVRSDSYEYYTRNNILVLKTVYYTVLDTSF